MQNLVIKLVWWLWICSEKVCFTKLFSNECINVFYTRSCMLDVRFMGKLRHIKIMSFVNSNPRTHLQKQEHNLQCLDPYVVYPVSHCFTHSSAEVLCQFWVLYSSLTRSHDNPELTQTSVSFQWGCMILWWLVIHFLIILCEKNTSCLWSLMARYCTSWYLWIISKNYRVAISSEVSFL